MPRSFRDVVATTAMQSVNAVSRRTGRGQGTVAGGRVAMRISPRLLERLAAPLDVVLVSGTNGKTTTTALLAAALSGLDPVATNSTGSNMLEGHLAALAASPGAAVAVLECDEVWLPTVLSRLRPSAVVLLNLSRDQLDRTSEVRTVAHSWRAALDGFGGVCVANADDPLIAFAARRAGNVAWFAGGRVWSQDATSCPNCLRGVELTSTSWECVCGESRPTPHAVAAPDTVAVDGVEIEHAMALPGEFNRSNALAALLAAVRLGIPATEAAHLIGAVSEVAGRFARFVVDGRPARLMLAKNPAGWTALLELVERDSSPLVLVLNARIADGRDPSWIYDVDFERLRGRTVVASGERWRDLSARLYYADVSHEVDGDPTSAIRGAGGEGEVDVIANYTAFASLRTSLARVR